MNTKLTLRLDEQLIESAKHYAAQEGRSVSELVAAYFTRLSSAKTDAPVTATKSTPTAPRRSAFYGLLAGSDVDAWAYRKHLQNKQQ